MTIRHFDQFTVGERFTSPARTMTEADVVLFAGLSGDFNPIHTDAIHAQGTPFGQRLVHGPLVLGVALALFQRMGMTDGTAIALLGIDEWRFVAPVFIGDTIHVEVTIRDLRRTSRLDRGILFRNFEVLNQNGAVVQTGMANLLVAAGN